MRQAEVTRNQPPGASAPTCARLISAAEFDSLADLKIEYSRRIGELKTTREDLRQTADEKRRAQDLYAAAAIELADARRKLVMAEKRISDDTAKWQGLDSTINAVLASWLLHTEECDEHCIAAVHVPRDYALMFSGHGVGGDNRLIPCDTLLTVATEDRDEDVIRMAATALATAVREGVLLYRAQCACPVTECDPCSTHAMCVVPGEHCAMCLREDEPSRRDDEEYDAAKGGAA